MDERVAIYNAVLDENKRILFDILQQGCSPDIVLQESTGLCGLILATVKGKIDIVRIFIRYKASLNSKDKRGMTALMYACVYKNEQILSLLKSAGADLTVADDNGKTALHHAAQVGDVACLTSLLIQSSVDLNHVDSQEKSAVMLAACGDNADCLTFLVDQNGVDLDRTDKDGNSPLIAAVHRRKNAHAWILLDKGAKVNVKNLKGKTALSKAFEQTKSSDMIEMVEKILLHGAKPTCYDELYLHEMIARGKQKIVRLMLINGCTPQLRQCRENTFKFDVTESISPLAVAFLSNQHATARYLLANLFLTPFDITSLPNCREITIHLTQRNYNQCLSLLKAMSLNPLPLFMLTFMAVRSLTFNKDHKYETEFQQVILAQLPSLFQQKLRFKTNLASLCVREWETIPLMFETGQTFQVTAPLYSVWPIGHRLTQCQFRCCSKGKGYRLMRTNPLNLSSLTSSLPSYDNF